MTTDHLGLPAMRPLDRAFILYHLELAGVCVEAPLPGLSGSPMAVLTVPGPLTAGQADAIRASFTAGRGVVILPRDPSIVRF